MGLGAINVDVGKIFSFLGKAGDVAKGFREAITGKTIVDPAEMKKLENEAVELDNSIKEAVIALSSAQSEINKIEAQSKSKFIAGWRPFVGWVCGLAFGLHFLLFPIANVVLSLIRVDFEFPTFDMMTMVNVLLGMLGLGAMRSYEKKEGVQDYH